MPQKSIHSVTPSQIYIVEASAGSGKTYALARHYIHLLLGTSAPPNNIPLRHILAMTFTNKAALEMKGRILDFLKKTALNKLTGEEQESILDPLSVDRKFVQQKAFWAMDHLIRHYNFFQVQTIDSFINALLSACAFKIGLSANFRIMRNYGDYLQHSLEDLMDKALTDKKIFKVFEDFLTQYLFLEHKTGWFPKKEILALMNSLFTSANKYGGRFSKTKIGGKGLFALKKEILEHLQTLKANLPEGTDKRFAHSLVEFLADHPDSFGIDELPDYFQREQYPVNKGYRTGRKVDRLWQTIRGHLRNLSELKACALFDCYIDMYDLMMADFKILAAQDDVLFLEELNRKAMALFQEGSLTVAELYYRLATRFKHYLIDEFQDTSVLQWKNLSLMIEEALATGGSLFYVGDKKQAIYRFRGGEMSLFKDIQKQMGLFQIQHEILLRNFRSQKEIVRFNNEIFGQDNLRRFMLSVRSDKNASLLSLADVEEVLEVFKDSQQPYRPEYQGGFVHVEYIDGQDKQQRTAVIRGKIIDTIKELKNRFSCRDLAILTRDNDEVTDVTAWLLAEGIPVESDRTLNIRENSLVKEVISFLRFLNLPVDNLSFASFILGDIFTQATGLKTEAMHTFLFHLHERAQKQKEIHYYKEFRQVYPLIWQEYFEGFFKAVGFYPLYELVISFFTKFKVPERFVKDQGFLMRFLELIKSKEEEQINDIRGFLEFFQEAEQSDLYVHVTQADSVHVLTIHKAKGLEFPVVMIPFLGMDVQVGSEREAYMVSAEKHKLRLLRLKKTYNRFSPFLEDMYRQEYRRAFLDELNNIYVALTRAKDELYIFIPSKVNKGNNLARALIPGAMPEIGQRRIYARGQSELPVFEIPPARYQDWITALKDEFFEEEQIKNRQRLRQGEVVHFILSCIGNIFGQNKQEIVQKALATARDKFPEADNFKESELKVRRLLAAKPSRKFFEVDSGRVYQEREMVDGHGHTKRIDRLIEKETEVWLIDYKSSAEAQEDDHQQVREYLKLTRAIYPQKTVKGFLLYLDDLTVKEVHGRSDYF